MELHTEPLSVKQLQEELNYLATYCVDNQIFECAVMLGYGWALSYYKTADWTFEKVRSNNLTDWVSQHEEKRLGKLGGDDLYIKIPQVEFKFCNESDIHIVAEKPNKHTRHFKKRWQTLGYKIHMLTT